MLELCFGQLGFDQNGPPSCLVRLDRCGDWPELNGPGDSISYVIEEFFPLISSYSRVRNHLLNPSEKHHLSNQNR